MLPSSAGEGNLLVPLTLVYARPWFLYDCPAHVDSAILSPHPGEKKFPTSPDFTILNMSYKRAVARPRCRGGELRVEQAFVHPTQRLTALTRNQSNYYFDDI